jgi:hypothetical protein
LGAFGGSKPRRGPVGPQGEAAGTIALDRLAAM